MTQRQAAPAPRTMGETVILDFLALGARAVLAALVTALGLAAIVLLLSGAAQAAAAAEEDTLRLRDAHCFTSPTSTSAAFISP